MSDELYFFERYILDMDKKNSNKQSEIIQFIKDNSKCSSQEILKGISLEISIVVK